MMCGWVVEKHAFVNLIGISPLWDWRLGFVWWDKQPLKPCQTNYQMTKHEKMQHVFIPFVFMHATCFYTICI